MANHGWVYTYRWLTPERINEVIFDLNQRLFSGNLKYTWVDRGWNQRPTWELEYISPIDEKVYYKRTCWLQSMRHFELRHGPGSNFTWWIDSVILNEIAVRFSGMIHDDGVELETWMGQANKHDDLFEYIAMHYRRPNGSLFGWKWLIKLEIKTVPPELRKELKQRLKKV